MPKRKPLPPMKDPMCICGHPLSKHGNWGCQHEGEDMREVNRSRYCPCNKFVDLRHCKIPQSDPVLSRFIRHPEDTSQEACRSYDGTSAAMASRRFNLFKCLRLIKTNGFYQVGFRTVEEFSLDNTRFKELREKGVIVP